MHVERRLLSRALRRISVLIAIILTAATLPLLAGAPALAAAPTGGKDPGGNNGTVKVQEVDFDDPPNNDPHVGCTFLLEWYGFDEGDDVISKVTFEMQAPTGSVGLSVDGPLEVFVGGDPASGAGTPTGLDGREQYTLSFDGPPHPIQGYHVKLTINTPGSKGADKKHKVFWVEGCDPVPSSIFLEKTVTDANGDQVGSLDEVLTYGFQVTNTGHETLSPVTISDPMFSLSDALCVTSLAPGETTDCPELATQTHVVTADDVNRGSVVNTATTWGTPPTGPRVSDDDDATMPVPNDTQEDVDLSIDKTANVSVAAPGDQIVYTLRVVNSGDGDAHDVVVTDTLPGGTSYVSSSSPCTFSSPTVTCALGTVEGGDDRDMTITVRVQSIGTGTTSHNHHLDYTKIEAHLSLFEGDTSTATANCPTGYLATDGSVRLDHVDQGTGTFEDAVVLASEVTSDGRGWTGTVRNDAVGQVQAKVNVVCMTDKTTSGEDHSHPVVVSGPVLATRTMAAGRHVVEVDCAPNTYAVTPSFAFTSGEGVVSTRRIPTGWRFTVDVDDASEATFSVRCLSTALGQVSGHSHDLRFEELSDSVSVPAGQVVERRLTCQGDHKGIVAWADMDPGLVSLGNDPQPVTRVYRFYNPTGSALTARYGLLCVAIRTNGGNQGDSSIKNTASVVTSSPDSNTADNRDSVTVTVSATGVAVAPRASVVTVDGKTTVRVQVSSARKHGVGFKLLAARKLKGTSLEAGSTLASARTRVKAGQATVRLVARGPARAALKSGKVTRAKLVMTVGKKRSVRVVKLR